MRFEISLHGNQWLLRTLLGSGAVQKGAQRPPKVSAGVRTGGKACMRAEELHTCGPARAA